MTSIVIETYEATSAESRVALVDFDWAGKDGECKYPVTLDLGKYSKTWAPQVEPYSDMEKCDNLWQLDQLKELYAWARKLPT